MKLSDIIGKQVFDIYDAKFLGTIHDANFDEKYNKVMGFYFFDQEENEFYIKRQNIYSLSDLVTIKNSTKISSNFVLDKPLSPLGKIMVGVDGKDYGNLNDIELDENYNIVKFISTKDQLLPSEIMFISSSIVVGENVKMQSFRPKQPKNQEILNNLTVSVMKMEDDIDNKLKLMPSKITVNSDVLLGKKLSKDIIGKNNELILKQNQLITPKQVVIAKQHDKLNELFYSVY